MARPERFELPTFGSVDRRSIQLSYGRVGAILGERPEREFVGGGPVRLQALSHESACTSVLTAGSSSVRHGPLEPRIELAAAGRHAASASGGLGGRCGAEGGSILRERKKQKTRETIVSAAMKLFTERGYEHTTIADIAEAAVVSPRTVSTYFPTKEDILFADTPELHRLFARALEDRSPGVSALDALREIIAQSLDLGPHELQRRRIVGHHESLRHSQRVRRAQFEEIMVDAIATDLGAGPDDIRPQIVAAALLAAFNTIRERDLTATSDSFSSEQAMAVVDDVIGFVRAGLQAFKAN
jgi:AcrR family transcriptional regulator